MGVSKDYHTAVSRDPPDDQLKLYIDALRGAHTSWKRRVSPGS